MPSAFTERTGKDHWEVLLRARAIENLAYVVAPAQVGHHGRGRASHGHAMIVDPWGAVLAQVPDGEGWRWRSWTSTARTASAASCPPSTTSASG